MKLHKVKKRTAEPKNIPPRRIESSSGGQVSKDGIASLTLFLNIDRIHYSMFDAYSPPPVGWTFDLPAMP
jgi:hypothetical protein